MILKAHHRKEHTGMGCMHGGDINSYLHLKLYCSLLPIVAAVCSIHGSDKVITPKCIQKRVSFCDDSQSSPSQGTHEYGSLLPMAAATVCDMQSQNKSKYTRLHAWYECIQWYVRERSAPKSRFTIKEQVYYHLWSNHHKEHTCTAHCFSRP